MGSRSKQSTKTLSGLPVEVLRGTRKHARFIIKTKADNFSAVVVLLNDDFEIAFECGEAVAFRRKKVRYCDQHANPHGYSLASHFDEPYKPVPREQFRTLLFDNMLIALRRVMASHDIVAEASELGGVISKALEELEKVATTTTDDPDQVREAVLDVRMRLFSRYVGLDKRRRTPEDRRER